MKDGVKMNVQVLVAAMNQRDFMQEKYLKYDAFAN